MRRSTTLESRLTDWAREYRGGRYENVGWQGVSPLSVAMKYGGPGPQGLNPGRMETNSACDEVEQAIRALAAQASGAPAAAVIRCHYLASSHTKDEKLRKLGKVGYPMGPVRYSQHLRLARIHVAGWLHVTFDEPLDIDSSLDMLEFVAGA
jgi:hypothetical protein